MVVLNHEAVVGVVKSGLLRGLDFAPDYGVILPVSPVVPNIQARVCRIRQDLAHDVRREYPSCGGLDAIIIE